MKFKTTLSFLALFFVLFCYAQSPNSEVGGGEFVFNPEKKSCITPEQRLDMIQEIQANIEELRQEHKLSFSEDRRGNHPLFEWPLQKANGVS